jgi:hypothetical protein
MQDVTHINEPKQTETVNSIHSFEPRNLQPDFQNASETCELPGKLSIKVLTQDFRAKCKKTVLFELVSYLLNSFRVISPRFVRRNELRPRRANRTFRGKK